MKKDKKQVKKAPPKRSLPKDEETLGKRWEKLRRKLGQEWERLSRELEQERQAHEKRPQKAPKDEKPPKPPKPKKPKKSQRPKKQPKNKEKGKFVVPSPQPPRVRGGIPHMAAPGLRRRWMINSLVAVLAVAMALLMLFTMFFSNYCYRAMQNGLETKSREVTSFFSSYATNENAYLSMANYYMSDFPDRDKMEMQFLSTRGQLLLSSYALTFMGEMPGTSDIENALSTGKISSWVGRDPRTAERIMAVSSPILHNGEVRGVMRLVTSLTLVDRQIVAVVCLALFLMVVVVLMVYMTNMYFIKSVVEPIARITETASGIAQGNYGVEIEKKYDDEVGDLIDAVNNMSSKLSQSEKMKSEFISSVSHELRTPLTAINGWSETLLTGEIADSESVRKGLSIIVSEGKRLSKMVEELLEFSRIQDGRLSLNMEAVDIQAEIEDAVFTYRQFYKKKNIKMTYRDDAGELDPIPADPERLKQVFTNVLDNAAKHGGADQAVEVTVSEGEGRVIIRVRDHGPGVPEKDLPHVKEMFYKASSKVRGNGIGLAVCDEIVTRHGGTFDIANAEGGGCVVSIALPLTLPGSV